jgi:peptidoglycan/xylan/chitin deacetylase (PgdA/CDA1 family)
MLAILNYHNVAPVPAGMQMPKLYVEPEEFARQLWWLRRAGLTGVTLTEGLGRLREGDAARCVALTFDDGYADNVTNALPILKEYGFRATCFIVSHRLGAYNTWDADVLGGRKQLMTIAQLAKWVDAGFEVGSHTCTHPDLTAVSRTAAMHELAFSRQTLQALTGQAIPAFCYPFGAYNSETLQCVASAGYECAVTARRGRAERDTPSLALPRVSVNGRKGLLKFLLKARTPYADFGRLWTAV